MMSKGVCARIKVRGGESSRCRRPMSTASLIAMLNDTCGNLIQLTQLTHAPASSQLGYVSAFAPAEVGALAWILAVPFFVAQFVVARTWTAPFSLRTRAISDLGNTACGPSHGAPCGGACSPWHTLVNASFVIDSGQPVAAGALLLRRAFRPGAPGTIAAAPLLRRGRRRPVRVARRPVG